MLQDAVEPEEPKFQKNKKPTVAKQTELAILNCQQCAEKMHPIEAFKAWNKDKQNLG